MKKAFQKSLLVAAMGVAALAGTAVHAGSYGTQNVMFPYITTSSTAFTFITLANNGTGASGAAHFRYAMKATTAANSVGCEHQDGNGTLTLNDVIQFEVANKVNVATALATGDTTGAAYTFSGGNDKHGYLIVNTNGLSNQNIYGEAVVIDTATGLRLAYSTGGLNTDSNTTALTDYTINNTGIAGGPEVAPTFTPSGALTVKGTNVVTWYNSANVTTNWFVVPLGNVLEMTPAGAVGGVIAGYNMGDSAGVAGQNGAYDLNEAFHSGAIRSDVRCIGVLGRANMLQPGALANTNRGGTAHLSTFNAFAVTADNPAGGTAQTANKSLVYKLQSTSLVGGASTFVSRESVR